MRGCPVVGGLVGRLVCWSVGRNAGYCSDVPLPLEDAQVIPPFSREETDDTDDTDDTEDFLRTF